MTDRLLIRPVLPSDADVYVDLIDDTIMRINGFPEHYQRDVRLAVEFGHLSGTRVLTALRESRTLG